MKRVTLDCAGPEVKEFIQSLPLQSGGVELELEGRVICNVVPPGVELLEAEKAVLLQRGRELVRRSRQRNLNVPEQVIEEEVGRAVDEVRRQNAQ
jgi:hypothetical protein